MSESSSVPPPSGMPEAGRPRPTISPLLPSDPPRIGGYWLESRMLTAVAGVAYLVRAADAPQATERGDASPGQLSPDAVLVRLSEGAAADAAARDRFSGLVNKLHIDTVLARGGHGQDEGRWARRFVPEQGPSAADEAAEAPWVALAYSGTEHDLRLADHLLAEVELRTATAQGSAAGPDYRHYWLNRIRPGLARVWPLPWPGRRERAGWQTILISWLLMLLLTVLAVLIAIRLFENEPPINPPEPVPQTASGTAAPQSGSPSPGETSSPTESPSASGSESGSASPSPTDGSGSPSTASASPQPSGTESGGGQESPRSRL